MKKTILTILSAMALTLSSCFSTGLGTSGLGTTGTSGNVLGSVLGSVLGNVLFGGMTFDQSSLLGNWNYNAPTAAFTTQQALTKAGGDAVVSRLASSLASNYSNIGINQNNTSFSFLQGNKFSAKVNGIPFSGTYTYNQQKTGRGMGLMFDAKQMANLLQKEGKVSNKSAVSAVSKLAKSSDGARVGFELTK